MRVQPKRVPSFSSRPGFPNGLRVLLIEPDTSGRQAIQEMLTQCNYAVTPCTSATEAVLQLTKLPNGFDVILAEAKALNPRIKDSTSVKQRARSTPLLLMALNPSPEEVLLGIKLGAVDFLEKPLSPLKLRNIWQHTVRKMMADMDIKGQAESGQRKSGGCSTALLHCYSGQVRLIRTPQPQQLLKSKLSVPTSHRRPPDATPETGHTGQCLNPPCEIPPYMLHEHSTTTPFCMTPRCHPPAGDGSSAASPTHSSSTGSNEQAAAQPASTARMARQTSLASSGSAATGYRLPPTSSQLPSAAALIQASKGLLERVQSHSHASQGSGGSGSSGCSGSHCDSASTPQQGSRPRKLMVKEGASAQMASPQGVATPPGLVPPLGNALSPGLPPIPPPPMAPLPPGRWPAEPAPTWWPPAALTVCTKSPGCLQQFSRLTP
jgi:DNA-binding response OmpR family regulator